MADPKSSAKAPPAGTAPKARSTAPSPASPTLAQRAVGFFRASGLLGNGRGSGRQNSPTTRFIIGSITFVLVAEVLTYLMYYLNTLFNLHLQQPILGASATWFTWFFVVNVVLILGLWIVLNRMGFFPRSMWTASRANETRGSASSGSSGGNSKNVSQIPGIGKARTRAERRHIAASSAAKATNGKGSGATAETIPDTGHDETYDRVKAAQRSRKRRTIR